jgi:hypothetical protein
LITQMPQNTNSSTSTAAQKRAGTSTSTAAQKRAATEDKSQALQVVDVAVGAVPTAADAVKHTADQLRDAEARNQEFETLQHQVQNLLDSKTRPAQVETLKKRLTDQVEKAEAKGTEVRRQVTDQVVTEARKARTRVEPLYKERVEPVYKQRFEPVYRQRIEPTVKKVRERV